MITDFRVGDRVHHKCGQDALVEGIGPKGLNLHWWDDLGWASNVPTEDCALVARALYLDPAEIECLEVFADGSVEMLGAHSRSVMTKMMHDIAKRAKS